MNESLDLAVCSARAADDKQGSDTIIFDVGDLLSITGFFVITSASKPAGGVATLLEWDDRIPEFDVLLQELQTARSRRG